MMRRISKAAVALVAATAVGSLTACASGPLSAGASQTVSHTTGRLLGLVQRGPTCPVVQAASPCPDSPAPAAKVQIMRQSRVVAQLRADSRGRFLIRLPAGSYTVRVRAASGLPSERSAVVRIAAGRSAHVVLVLDTGIR